MAKAGMRRPDPYDPKNHGTEKVNTYRKEKDPQKMVPEIQGKEKTK